MDESADLAEEAVESESKEGSGVEHPLSNNGPVSNHVSSDSPTEATAAPSSQRGCCLSLSDHDRIRIFIHEFFVRGLIPWAERTLRILNDQVAASACFTSNVTSTTWRFFEGVHEEGNLELDHRRHEEAIHEQQTDSERER